MEEDQIDLGLEVNGKVLLMSSKICYFCITTEEKTARHHGYFVTVPKQFWRIWLTKIQLALQRNFSSQFKERFSDAVSRSDARVAVAHISLVDDGFDRGNPTFLPNTFKRELRPTISRSDLREQRKVLVQAKSDHETLQRIGEAEKEITKLQKKLKSPLPITQPPTSPPSPPSPSSSYVFSEEIRRNGRDYFASGLSYRKIAERLQREYSFFFIGTLTYS